MPSIHIPEDTWTQLLGQCDMDRAKAREAVKDAVRDRVEANNDE